MLGAINVGEGCAVTVDGGAGVLVTEGAAVDDAGPDGHWSNLRPVANQGEPAKGMTAWARVLSRAGEV